MVINHLQAFGTLQYSVPNHVLNYEQSYICIMEITTFTDFRQNLKKFMEMVLQNREPLFIKRPKGEDVVVLSKSDYTSMTETLFLLESPANAELIRRGIEELDSGGGIIQTPETL